MQPKDILAISGKPGLFKVLNTTHRAIVVESLGEGKRSAVPSSARVSSFEDISIFTYEEDLPLAEVLNAIHTHLKGGDAPGAKEPHDALRSFVTEVVSDLDQERVYHSDLKKLCSWYNQLNGLSLLPFTDEEETGEEAAEAPEAAVEGEAEAEAEVLDGVRHLAGGRFHRDLCGGANGDEGIRGNVADVLHGAVGIIKGVAHARDHGGGGCATRTIAFRVRGTRLPVVLRTRAGRLAPKGALLRPRVWVSGGACRRG